MAKHKWNVHDGKIEIISLRLNCQFSCISGFHILGSMRYMRST